MQVLPRFVMGGTDEAFVVGYATGRLKFDSMTAMDHERRDYPRVKIRVPVEIRTEDNDSPIRGATADLSLTGCYIETLFPYPIGTHLELKLQLEGTLLVLATVVTYDPQVGNGIQFSRMLPEDVDELRAFLEAKQNESQQEKE